MNAVRIINFKKTISDIPILLVQKFLRQDQLLIVDNNDLIVISDFNYTKLPLLNELINPFDLVAFQCINGLIKASPIYSFLQYETDTIHIFHMEESIILLGVFCASMKKEITTKLNEYYENLRRNIQDSETFNKIASETIDYFNSVGQDFLEFMKKFSKKKNTFRNSSRTIYSINFKSNDYNKYLVLNDISNHNIMNLFIHDKLELINGPDKLREIINDR
jgi:hypothetical protein